MAVVNCDQKMFLSKPSKININFYYSSYGYGYGPHTQPGYGGYHSDAYGKIRNAGYGAPETSEPQEQNRYVHTMAEFYNGNSFFKDLVHPTDFKAQNYH